MLQRILVAVIFVPLILLLLLAAPPIAIPIVISVLSMIAVHEVLWSTGFVKNAKLSGYSIVLAGLIPFWVYIGQGMFSALCGLFIYFTLVFITAISSHYTVTMEKMGGAFFFAALIPYFLSTFIRLDTLVGAKYMILTPLIVAFLSDAMALFAGLAFGKHKLAPELSPKKTVEGAIGGVCGATAAAVLSGVLAGPLFGVENCRLWVLAIYGVAGSILSQLGDLSFSYIKREYGLKDFGDLFPGHGGVLDRFDSVIFCAPFVEIMLYLLPVVK